jgi:hypothetical protein
VTTVLAYLGCAALAAGAAWCVLAVLAARRAGRAAVSGVPTEAEAKIEVETKRTAGEIAAAAEKKAKEIVGADKPSTLRMGRDSLWKRSVRKP